MSCWLHATLRTYVSHDHGLLLTSTGWVRVCRSTVTQGTQLPTTGLCNPELCGGGAPHEFLIR